MSDQILSILRRGVAIPACPLALTAARRLDERRQRALFRYYAAAGAGGLAVGVHTMQFAIRNPEVGLFKPVLELAAEELDRADSGPKTGTGTVFCSGGTTGTGTVSVPQLMRVAGILGGTAQAVGEALLARRLGYHAGLLSLAALKDADLDALIAHCRAVAEAIPVIGFYLQPAVGGRVLPYGFWRRFAEIPNVVAIKIAPFNRYQTIDVVRAVVEAGRDDIALYTGNDDNIVADLVTPYRFDTGGMAVQRRIVGGLLGHWAVWTKAAVGLLAKCQAAARANVVSADLLCKGIETTDMNAAVFDAANGFSGCIAGIHEVLRRQGLLEGIWCLDEHEGLGPGQSQELDRVSRAYPHLIDDAFVAEHRDDWLRG